MVPTRGGKLSKKIPRHLGSVYGYIALPLNRNQDSAFVQLLPSTILD